MDPFLNELKDRVLSTMMLNGEKPEVKKKHMSYLLSSDEENIPESSLNHMRESYIAKKSKWNSDKRSQSYQLN